MAQTGYTPIQLYRTATASAAPTSGNLADGELAINTLDGKLFYKDSSGSVQTIASKATGSVGGSTTQVQFNNSGVLGGSSGLTWSGTALTATAFSGPINGTVGATTPAAITGTTITANTAFAGPLNGTVGATTPSTGAFTTLAASSTVSGTGFSTYLASPPAIGGTAAAAGSFTTLASSGAATMSGILNANNRIIVANTQPNIDFYQAGVVEWWIGTKTSDSKLWFATGTPPASTSGYATLDSTGNFTASANITAYSDERVKTNWRSMDAGFLKQLSEIKAGTYDRTDTDAPMVQVGVSAQDLQKILGPAVLEDADGMLSVAYGNAALVAAVELCKEVQRLNTEIETLKTQFHIEVGAMKAEFAEEIIALKARPICKCAS